MWARIVAILTGLVGPILNVGLFLTTRGGKLLTAATTFVGLLAEIWYLISANLPSVKEIMSSFAGEISQLSNYITGLDSLPMAFLYYTSADTLCDVFVSVVAVVVALIIVILVTVTSLLLSAIIPMLLAHIGSYVARSLTKT